MTETIKNALAYPVEAIREDYVNDPCLSSPRIRQYERRVSAYNMMLDILYLNSNAISQSEYQDIKEQIIELQNKILKAGF
jgi:hypothetical protein